MAICCYAVEVQREKPMTTPTTDQAPATGKVDDEQLQRAYRAAREAWLETLTLLRTSDDRAQWRHIEQDAWHVVEHFRNILKIDE